MSTARYWWLASVALAASVAAYLLAGRSLASGGAVLALTLPLLFLLAHASTAIRRRAGGGRGDRTVVICGPSGSGKTALFLALSEEGQVNRDSSQRPLTAPSVTANKGHLAGQLGHSSPPIVLVDIPGSEKARDGALSRALPTADKVLLLLDTTSSNTLLTEAPFIVRVLAEGVKRRLPCMLLLGKSEAGIIDSSQFVRALDEALAGLARRLSSAPEDAGEELVEHVKCIQEHLGIDGDDPISFSTLDVPVMLYSDKDEQSLAQVKAWICDAQ